MGPGTGTPAANKSSWYDYQDSIKKVVFASGADGSKVVAPVNSTDLFYGLGEVVSADLRGLDTSNVEDLSGMFYECTHLERVGVTGLDTSNVKSIDIMFGYCGSLVAVEGLEGLDLSKVTTLTGVFFECSSLSGIDLSCLAGARVDDAISAFSGCANVAVICLSGIDTSQMGSAIEMFGRCVNLETIYVDDGWSTENLVSYDDMFAGCKNLEGGAGTEYNPSKVGIEYARVDGGPTSPGYLTYKKARTSIKNASVTLSATSFTYNGSVQKPAVASVKLGDTTLSANSDYTVSYLNPNSKDIGTYTVTVIGKNGYRGSRSATYKINAAPNPTPTPTVAEIVDLPKVKIVKPKAGKKSMTVKWKKISKKNLKKIKKVQIQYSTDKSFASGVKTKLVNAKKTSVKVKKLKSKKRYYVRIRAYTKTGDAVHVSKWSAKKPVKVK